MDRILYSCSVYTFLSLKIMTLRAKKFQKKTITATIIRDDHSWVKTNREDNKFESICVISLKGLISLNKYINNCVNNKPIIPIIKNIISSSFLFLIFLAVKIHFIEIQILYKKQAYTRI